MANMPRFKLMVQLLFMFVAILQQRIHLLVCDRAIVIAATIRRNCGLRRQREVPKTPHGAESNCSNSRHVRYGG
jgi:hypothetical protein